MKNPLIIITLIVMAIAVTGLASQTAAAADVGVAITFPDGSVHGECVRIATGSDGYEVMQKLDIGMTWAGPTTFGHQLCKVDNVGDDVGGEYCEYSGKYWGLFTSTATDYSGEWEYMPVGYDGGDGCWNGDPFSYDGHYCAADGDLVGLRYGEYGDMPDFFTYQNLCEPLQVKEIKVYVDGSKESGVDETGGRIDVIPGDSVEFRIELESLTDFEFEIEDIEAVLESDDLDVDEEVSFSDLDEGDDDEATIEFIIPLLVEEDTYDVELTIKGDIRDGSVDQEIVIDYTIKVDKERHDLELKYTLNNVELCPGDEGSATIELLNLGSNDENVEWTLKNEELSIDFSGEVELDEGDGRSSEFMETIAFKVPSNVIAGVYDIVFIADYGTAIGDTKTLTVVDCGQGNTAESGTVVEQQQTQQRNEPKIYVVQNSPAQQQTASSDDRSWIERNMSELLLGVLLVLLISIVLFVATIIRQ